MTFFFPDPTPIFPTLRSGYSVMMKPMFSTAVQTRVSGYEARSARQGWPLWEFTVPFEELADETQNAVPDSWHLGQKELQRLCGLFLACKGQYGRFYFTCPEDKSRSAQLLGTADGSRTVFRALRTWGTGATSFTEPVGGINTLQAWKVYQNGVDDTANWTVTDNYTNFTRSSAPANGVVITADFFFYYFCRFIEDLQDYDQFYSHLWQLKACKFRSAKT